MRVIYLHGFASIGNSGKSRWLAEQFAAEGIEFMAPDLPNKPAEAIKFLDAWLGEQQGSCTLIGASLGGLYAASYGGRFGWPVVLINPLADITGLDRRMGENVNYYTEERFVVDREDADALKRLDAAMPPLPEQSMLLLDQGDETLDYRVAEARFSSAAVVQIYAGGSHRFEHLPEAWPALLQLVRGNS